MAKDYRSFAKVGRLRRQNSQRNYFYQRIQFQILRMVRQLVCQSILQRYVKFIMSLPITSISI